MRTVFIRIKISMSFTTVLWVFSLNILIPISLAMARLSVHFCHGALTGNEVWNNSCASFIPLADLEATS